MAAGLAHGLILGYQLSLSGLIGRQCRFLPSCSDYMDEAIARHGLWRGGWLGATRFCDCHPWGGSGYDPVPDRLPALAPWRLRRACRAQERASNCADSP
ncbi:membrane protein insertion efficiency factor YidD [Lichenihabitans sp. Uapishka_5]|uniref:membrane protein insertion efficiency factor YidD n=1 Tax=Lichenihabitans sp. Uapishka_5 TaxID=3037302 RepID=UPI003FA5CB54